MPVPMMFSKPTSHSKPACNPFTRWASEEEEPDYGILPDPTPKRHCLGCGALLRRGNDGNYCGPCDAQAGTSAAGKKCQTCGSELARKDVMLGIQLCRTCQGYYAEKHVGTPATLKPLAPSTAEEARRRSRPQRPQPQRPPQRAQGTPPNVAQTSDHAMPGWVPRLTWKDMVP